MQRGEAAEMLGETEAVRRATRSARGGVWFPLVLFGALTLLALPLYGGGLGAFAADFFWMLAGPAGYVAVVMFHRRRETRTGVGAPILPYVIVGIALLLVGMGLVGLPIPPVIPLAFAHLSSGFGPLVAIALGLLVLAWVERSLSLALFALVQGTVAALAGLSIVNNPLGLSGGTPQVANAAVIGLGLVGAGLVARAAERRRA